MADIDPVILGAVDASLRERIDAGETVDDLGRNIWVVRAGIICKRAEFCDDEEARGFGRQALSLLRDRAAEGDDEAAKAADLLIGRVPELGDA
ncbi:hypothetical protein ACFSCW_03440 [Sphingomonas tabacisoli]|uniref:Uncharacterized protein n=1 Tax=Sphingomonas tabacisoli TaxID=2249466 RepID=A0ABW4HZZ4_9SPHN